MANINGTNSANNLIGTAFADNIDARGGNNFVDAGDGDDYVNGGNGNDTIKGGRGSDLLFGGANNDRLNGGDDNDQLDGGSGTHWADFDGGSAVNVDLVAGTAFGQGNDTLFIIENVIGSDASDFINGNAGNNIIHGGGSTDTIYANMGVDHYDGDTGANDADYFKIQPGVTASLATNIYSFDASNYGMMANIDNLIGVAGDDILTGSAAFNKIDGGAGNDIVAGGLGNDQMWAGADSDRLIADGGNDELSGNYSLEGFGDNASDIFDIRTTAGTVTIVDFDIGIDKIDFTDFNLGNSSYWTASAAQSSPSVTTLTLTVQAQERRSP
jgi:Ca2+-binding RTX toxin-like protein